jgi:hypothetical protein
LDLSLVMIINDIAITDDSFSIALSNLNISDDIGTLVSATSGKFELNYLDAFNQGRIKDAEPYAFEIALNDAEAQIADISLSGDAAFSSAFDPEEQFESTRGNFGFDINGSLTNSQGDTLNATTKVIVESDFGNSYSYYTGQYYDDIDMEFSVKLDLTEKTSNNTLFIAEINYEMTADNLSYEADSVNYLNFDGKLALTVGNTKLGLGLNLNVKDDEVDTAYLYDSTNTMQDVRIVYVADVNSDFDSDRTIIGQITVNGNKQADLILDMATYEVIADFSNLSDVVLISQDNLDLESIPAIN